ncbi:unnamed protein product [Cercospora beticola]|nr:unnamed protein product [Cercospora beticola]
MMLASRVEESANGGSSAARPFDGWPQFWQSSPTIVDRLEGRPGVETSFAKVPTRKLPTATTQTPPQRCVEFVFQKTVSSGETCPREHLLVGECGEETQTCGRRFAVVPVPRGTWQAVARSHRPRQLGGRIPGRSRKMLGQIPISFRVDLEQLEKLAAVTFASSGGEDGGK